ncbi:glycosyl transferase [Asanoa ishikariensis]|uniref:Glycosyltransferase, GT2 family n=1 Tax=Asanoa ishikariensis TaxID=137265 RepID=A0A1H3LJK6_9ACTN|nr:glycosyltransferase family 2 protein [Asanoa ishikariensis]GIF65531.1 glycosyl transferase [Asanoa ishikariensis]SDY64662.1 Glycosyltransferase, GT2 family [Asanoa ishikariensis]
MRLTVGVLTYRSAANLPPLLAALPAGLAGVDDWRLVVVDSGSFDDTLTVAKDLAPDATLVQLDSNRGFAAAANAVAAVDPDADAVLLLSPTTRLRPGCAARLLTALAEPGVGIAVPRLIGRDGAYKTSLRRRPTLGRAVAEAVLGGNRASRLGRGELIADPAGYDRQTRADWATGAVTMFSRAALAAAGPWDESFFLYSEETEFALRAADHGFRLAFVPEAEAVHNGGDARNVPALWGIMVANRVRLHAMRHGRAAGTAYWAAITLGEAIRSIRDGNHRYATRKLLRERTSLVSGRPAGVPDQLR